MTQVAEKTVRLRTWRVRRTIIDRLRATTRYIKHSDGFRDTAKSKGPHGPSAAKAVGPFTTSTEAYHDARERLAHGNAA